MKLRYFLKEKAELISFSEANRYIACGAVSVNGIETHDMLAEVKAGDIVKVGKRTYTVSDEQAK